MKARAAKGRSMLSLQESLLHRVTSTRSKTRVAGVDCVALPTIEEDQSNVTRPVDVEAGKGRRRAKSSQDARPESGKLPNLNFKEEETRPISLNYCHRKSEDCTLSSSRQ